MRVSNVITKQLIIYTDMASLNEGLKMKFLMMFSFLSLSLIDHSQAQVCKVTGTSRSNTCTLNCPTLVNPDESEDYKNRFYAICTGKLKAGDEQSIYEQKGKPNLSIDFSKAVGGDGKTLRLYKRSECVLSDAPNPDCEIEIKPEVASAKKEKTLDTKSCEMKLSIKDSVHDNVTGMEFAGEVDGKEFKFFDDDGFLSLAAIHMQIKQSGADKDGKFTISSDEKAKISKNVIHLIGYSEDLIARNAKDATDPKLTDEEKQASQTIVQDETSLLKESRELKYYVSKVNTKISADEWLGKVGQFLDKHKNKRAYLDLAYGKSSLENTGIGEETRNLCDTAIVRCPCPGNHSAIRAEYLCAKAFASPIKPEDFKAGSDGKCMAYKVKSISEADLKAKKTKAEASNQ